MAPGNKDGIDTGTGPAADIVEGVTGKDGTGFICTKQGHGLKGWFSVGFVFSCIFRGYQNVKIPGGVCRLQDFLQAESSS